MAKDPVFSMDVDPKTAAGQSEYQGQTFFFCSIGCKNLLIKSHRNTLQFRDLAPNTSITNRPVQPEAAGLQPAAPGTTEQEVVEHDYDWH